MKTWKLNILCSHPPIHPSLESGCEGHAQWRLVHGRCLAQPGCQAALQHPAGQLQKCENGRGRAGWGACLSGHSAVGYVFPWPPCVRSGSGHTHSELDGQVVGHLVQEGSCGLLLTQQHQLQVHPPWAAGPWPRGQHASLPSGFWSCALSSAPWEQPNIGPVRFRLARTQRPRKGWSFLEKGEAQPCTGQSP